MVRIRTLLICFLACVSFSSTAIADNTDWRVYVAFVEEDHGSINKLSKSYQMAWVHRDANEKELGKAFKEAQKATVDGSKNKIYTREATTNSTKFLAIYEYTRDFPMWKGFTYVFGINRHQVTILFGVISHVCNNTNA